MHFIKTDNKLPPFKTATLVGVHEQIREVPEDERLTKQVGEYGGYVFKQGTAEATIHAAYEQALSDMAMDSDTFQSTDKFCYAGEIIAVMRDHLLAKELKLGEEVLFACTVGYAAPEDLALRAGVVKEIDPRNMTCTIRGEFFPIEDVPLHYVLARYDPASNEEHYGYAPLKPLFGEYPELAQHYLDEAQAQQLDSQQSAQAMGM